FSQKEACPPIGRSNRVPTKITKITQELLLKNPDDVLAEFAGLRVIMTIFILGLDLKRGQPNQLSVIDKRLPFPTPLLRCLAWGFSMFRAIHLWVTPPWMVVMWL
ncbi:MAG: hypothetical protein V3T42_00060, partial [Nitrospirales bacterium]